MKIDITSALWRDITNTIHPTETQDKLATLFPYEYSTLDGGRIKMIEIKSKNVDPIDIPIVNNVVVGQGWVYDTELCKLEQTGVKEIVEEIKPATPQLEESKPEVVITKTPEDYTKCKDLADRLNNWLAIFDQPIEEDITITKSDDLIKMFNQIIRERRDASYETLSMLDKIIFNLDNLRADKSSCRTPYEEIAITKLVIRNIIELLLEKKFFQYANHVFYSNNPNIIEETTRFFEENNGIVDEEGNGSSWNKNKLIQVLTEKLLEKPAL